MKNATYFCPYCRQPVEPAEGPPNGIRSTVKSRCEFCNPQRSPLETKLATVKKHYGAGEYKAALRIAAKFPQLGKHKAAITKGWAAVQNPEFYRELGESPEALFEAGVAALAERYGF